MDSTSRQQTEALERGELPPLDEVRDDVWALAQPMPGGHLAYSFTYLLRSRDGGVHVVDPGWDSDENWDRLGAALTEIDPGGSGTNAVTGITGTHLHPDHVGMAARLREASGAPFAMHAAERQALQRHSTRLLDLDEVTARLAGWGVPAERRGELAQDVDRSPEGLVLAVDGVLSDGDLLPVPGFRIEVLATPGHTPGHICLRDDDRGLLFTGDHVLPTVFAGIGLGGATPSNPLADYLASVDRVRGFPDHEALPGHGYRFRGLAGRAAECADHQLERSREVAAVLAASHGGPEPTVWTLASCLTWTAGWNGLHGFQLLSALTQTQMHRDFVRASAGRFPQAEDGRG
jgi:glyoxylase-like metal-dependent hydrolase (beta-lactamase superfamily II)